MFTVTMCLPASVLDFTIPGTAALKVIALASESASSIGGSSATRTAALGYSCTISSIRWPSLSGADDGSTALTTSIDPAINSTRLGGSLTLLSTYPSTLVITAPG